MVIRKFHSNAASVIKHADFLYPLAAALGLSIVHASLRDEWAHRPILSTKQQSRLNSNETQLGKPNATKAHFLTFLLLSQLRRLQENAYCAPTWRFNDNAAHQPASARPCVTKGNRDLGS